MMDKKLKKKWIKALLSGKYKQGRRQLRSGADRFCCLGVLCDVLDPAGWNSDGWHWFAYSSTTLMRPRRVGITPTERIALTRMNDGINGRRARTFKTIAKWIKENL